MVLLLQSHTHSLFTLFCCCFSIIVQAYVINYYYYPRGEGTAYDDL